MSMPSAQEAIRPFVLALNTSTSRQLLAPLSLSIGAYALYKFIKFVWWEYVQNPLNDLPGPANSSLWFGHMREFMAADISGIQEEWARKYGNTIQYKGLFGHRRLFTADLKAINHIMNSLDYQKPVSTRVFLGRLLGNGIILAEGDEHRKQRKVMNPAFGISQIRELTEIFVEKALELRDVWAQETKKQSPGDVQPARINVLNGLSAVTLDVIGLAAFNYKFNSVGEEKSELYGALDTIFASGYTSSLATFFRLALGKYYWLLPVYGGRGLREAKQTMDRIGNQLLNESKAAVASEGQDKMFERRDLLTLLVKANISANVPKNQRMREEDVLSQIPTFIVAGHETTSAAVAWALYVLCLHPDVQTKLREELFTIQTDNPTMDELNSLSYLDAVIRESMRVHSPVAAVFRVAVKDDIIPLAKPFVDKKGRLRDTIEMKKGQEVFIPIMSVNLSPEIWGRDAKEFKPERWESIPEAASTVPGVWGNLLTFFGGPRACIGFRFSVTETKALLFTLVRAFEFQLAVLADDIMKQTLVSSKPVLKSDPEAGSQLPLLITPHVREN